MRKALLFTGLFLFLSALTLFSQTITLKIEETHLDGGVSVSFDDGEFQNDEVDKLDDDDLDMGWEGEDGNIMTSFTRFRNVTIPQGSVITSAVLTIYAHEDEFDEAIITVYGEASDNAASINETDLLSNKVFTNASVNWTCSDEWIMWEPYSSPDLSSIIQEIIDRPGWQSGNAFTLYMKGQDQGASFLDQARDFESFENIEDPDDGGDGLHHPERIPTLVISYTIPNNNPLVIGNSYFNIFPNPVSSGQVNILLNTHGRTLISIYNITGETIRIIETQDSLVTVDLSDCVKGVYFISVSNSQISHIGKVILK
jgi:hypothetical protein